MSSTAAQIPLQDLRLFRQACYIDGAWIEVTAGNEINVDDPATGEIIGSVPKMGAGQTRQAIEAAARAFPAWRSRTAKERALVLRRWFDLMVANQDDLAHLMTLEQGKPLTESRGEVMYAASFLEWFGEEAKRVYGDTIPPHQADKRIVVIKEPIGVVACITPWNFPLAMITRKAGPALAAGCTVVLKPAEQTPLSALRLGELLEEAGFPDGVVNIVPGYGETAGAALASHPDVDKVAFTGSTEVGKLIIHAAAGNLKKVSLELGGKSPNIILEDADLETAIPGAAGAIFFNHGQCCCAGSRLYVEKKIFDKVVDGMAQSAEKIRVRPGFDPECDMGPLVSEEQLNRVCGYLESGKKEGAKAVTGGERYGDQGYFVKPTVLVDTTENMKVVQEEIFGPVVTAIPFSNPNEMVQKANDTVYGLAAGIWSRDIQKAHKLAAKLRAGTVWINCYNVFDPALPFGGYKQSGWGREMGHAALEHYTELKSVCAAL